MAGSVREKAETDVVVEWSNLLRKWVVSKHGIVRGEFATNLLGHYAFVGSGIPVTSDDLRRIADLMDSTPEVPEGH